MREQLLETARRNEAIARLMNFKRYIPSERVREDHAALYDAPMKWFHIPNVGKYNSFELRFHDDWNWLVSACCEFRKYFKTNPPGSKLEELFREIQNTNILFLEINELWLKVSDYALEVLNQMKEESKL